MENLQGKSITYREPGGRIRYGGFVSSDSGTGAKRLVHILPPEGFKNILRLDDGHWVETIQGNNIVVEDWRLNKMDIKIGSPWAEQRSK